MVFQRDLPLIIRGLNDPKGLERDTNTNGTANQRVAMAGSTPFSIRYSTQVL